MRKQTKIAALVSAAALLAIGASMTSFAATWVGSDYDWTYVDRNGNAIEEEGWHRGNTEWGANAQYYYYADDEGKMLFSQIIDGDNGDFYYVDDHGRRVTDTWVKEEPEDGEYPMDDDTVVDMVDYYFGANGKAVRAKTYEYEAFTLIQDNGYSTKGTFVFDKNGVMQIGKVEGVGKGGDTYYCVQRDDYNFIGLDPEGTAWPYVTGQALNGWAKMDVEVMVDQVKDDYDNVEWFYFDSCKLNKTAGPKTISGVNYTFDGNGVLGQWDAKVAATTSDAANHDYKVYVNDSNASIVGNKWENFQDMDWYYIINARSLDNKANDLIKKGVIFNYTYTGTDGATGDGKGVSRLIKVGGKVYMIGPDGVMKTGFQKVATADIQHWQDDLSGGEYYWNGTNFKYYVPSTVTGRDDLYFYFDASEDLDGDRGELREGKISYTDDDGFTVTRLFKGDGAVDDGYVVCDNYLYNDGVLVTAEDETYHYVAITDGKKLTNYTVKNGKVNKDGKFGATDGKTYYIIVDRNGKIKRSNSRGLEVEGTEFTITDYVAHVK